MVVKLNMGMHVSESSRNLSLEKSRRALASKRLSASTIVALPHSTGCNKVLETIIYIIV